MQNAVEERSNGFGFASRQLLAEKISEAVDQAIADSKREDHGTAERLPTNSHAKMPRAAQLPCSFLTAAAQCLCSSARSRTSAK